MRFFQGQFVPDQKLDLRSMWVMRDKMTQQFCRGNLDVLQELEDFLGRAHHHHVEIYNLR